MHIATKDNITFIFKGASATNDSHYHHRSADGGIFDLFNGHCDGQNEMHINFAHQCNICCGSFTYTETDTGTDPSPRGFPHGYSYMMFKVHTGPKQGQIPIPNWLL